jgi:hypothetical protein
MTDRRPAAFQKLPFMLQSDFIDSDDQIAKSHKGAMRSSASASIYAPGVILVLCTGTVVFL